MDGGDDFDYDAGNTMRCAREIREAGGCGGILMLIFFGVCIFGIKACNAKIETFLGS